MDVAEEVDLRAGADGTTISGLATGRLKLGFWNSVSSGSVLMGHARLARLSSNASNPPFEALDTKMSEGVGSAPHRCEEGGARKTGHGSRTGHTSRSTVEGGRRWVGRGLWFGG
jgi:hypothetical protein